MIGGTLAQEHIVVAVHENHGGGREWWQVDTLTPGNTLPHLHAFPKATLDYRAAEYDLDPDDTDLLLDVILHERFIPDPTDPRNFDSDPAARAGHVVQLPAGARGVRAAAGRPVPAWLGNADTIAQARAAHLARIEHVKTTVARVVPPAAAARAVGAKVLTDDPLDVIRRAHRPDRALIAETAERVREMRARLRGEAPTR